MNIGQCNFIFNVSLKQAQVKEITLSFRAQRGISPSFSLAHKSKRDSSLRSE